MLHSVWCRGKNVTQQWTGLQWSYAENSGLLVSLKHVVTDVLVTQRRRLRSIVWRSASPPSSPSFRPCANVCRRRPPDARAGGWLESLSSTEGGRFGPSWQGQIGISPAAALAVPLSGGAPWGRKASERG